MGPMFSVWMDGYDPTTQAGRVSSGYPWVPTVRLWTDPAEANKTGTKGVVALYLAPHEAAYRSFNGTHIRLRMGNITGEMDKVIPRMASVTDANFHESWLSVRLKPDWTLDQTPYADPFGNIEHWRTAGRTWASSIASRKQQEYIPSPSRVTFSENNEGPRRQFKDVANEIRTKLKDENGNDYWVVTYSWRTDAEIKSISVQMAAWVNARRHLDPAACRGEFEAAVTERYQALYEAFESECPVGWHGKFQSVGYKGPDDNYWNDASSPQYYLGAYGRESDLTTPGAHTDDIDWTGEWAEYSIAPFLKSAIYSGAAAGRHDVVDPDSYAGLMTHVAWRMHSEVPSKDVWMVWWDNNAVKPGHFLFATQTNGTTFDPVHVAALTAIGRTDMLQLKVQDYELALATQLRRIHQHPVLSRYWQEGTTSVLYSPLNDASARKVYATVTEIPDEPRKLLCVYTPCDLTGEIPVGEWSVPPGRLRYWLTPVGLEEIE